VTLTSGTKLGPYEILSPLGAGGMGEVYRARDTRLDRTVAIKILPAELSNDSGAKQRFDREARVISSLNHPNICTLFDVGHQDGIDYLVMECLEGETLSARLMRGPLPPDQVLRFGIEICEGLERAHKCGVIHRDLKPGNIMLTKAGAKLMDFGLAKSHGPAIASSGSHSTTMVPNEPLTAKGTMVGTFQYMSPEQIEGREADARSEIFSLGAVLYEMATGKRAFEGKSAASVIGAVLDHDPEPISALRPMSPAALDRLVKGCLTKDPDDRWQTVHDVRLQLKQIVEGGSQIGAPAGVTAHRKNREALAWTLAAAALLAAIIATAFYFASQKPLHMVAAQIVLPAGLTLNSVGDGSGAPVISPDGNHVVFSAFGDGGSRLYLRALDRIAVTPLPGTENATFPFWSPDSGSIAFFAGGKLKRTEIAGGMPVNICSAPQARGGSWSSNDVIVFTPGLDTGLMQVPATGGTATQLLALDAKYTTYRWPWFLPDGNHFLYLAANHNLSTGPDNRVFFASLDGKENRPLFQSYSSAIFASGRLIFVRGGALVTQGFNPRTGRLSGDPVVFRDDVQLDGEIWRATISASETGTLLYQIGGAASRQQLVWFDRTGKQLDTFEDLDSLVQIQLSPNEKKLAIISNELAGKLLTYDLARKTKTRLSFEKDDDHDPVWSPDGSQIAYDALKAGQGTGIYSKPSSGAGPAVELLAPIPGENLALCDWSRDGRYIVFRRGNTGAGAGQDLWILPLFGDRKPFPYVRDPGDQAQAQFSPDGRWIAYSSTESGAFQIYVQPFPATGAKWQVSTVPAEEPHWRGDGKELFLKEQAVAGILAAEVNGSGSGFEVGNVKTLLRASLGIGHQGLTYAPTEDGQRFLAITTGSQSSTPLIVVENWTTAYDRHRKGGRSADDKTVEMWAYIRRFANARSM
jgi:Tol biopolymer transport system component